MIEPRSAWCDEPDPFCPPLTVYEAERGAIDTGLLDASGSKIYRRPLEGRIGFDLTPRRTAPPQKRRRAHG